MSALLFGNRRLSVLGLALAAVAGVAALALHVTDRPGPARVVALTVAVAVGLALHVDLPWGGRLTLGHAVLIALAVRADPVEALAASFAGVLLAVPGWVHDDHEGPLRVRLGGAVAVTVASFGGIALRLVLDAFGLGERSSLDPDVRTVVQAAVVGVTFLAIDHAIRALARTPVHGGAPATGSTVSLLRRAWPLYVTILCVAALIDLALRRSLATAFVATVPLLVTRFSFQRFTTAQHTYAQTTQALSLLPEVAGLTPLGHAERTSVYAAAVVAELDFDAERANRVVTAARLHHIGYVSLHEPEERVEPPDPAELAAVGMEILEETGFLGDLAAIVGDAQAGGPPAATLDAAVVRVCSSLDEMLEADDAADPFASLVALYPVGHERTVAIALLALQHRRPALVAEARAAASTLAQVAAGAAADGAHRHHDH